MKRNRRKGHIRRSTVGAVIFSLIIVLLIAAVIRLEKSIRPAAELRSEQAAKNAAERIISEAVADCLAFNDHTYDSFAVILYDESGNPAAVETLSANVNRIRSELTAEINKKLSEEADITASIPLGDLSSSLLFAGKGPRIRLHISSAGSARVELKSNFSAAGINQTCHKITAVITVTLRSAMPLYDFETTESFEFLIAESIIVGNTPEVFLEKNQSL